MIAGNLITLINVALRGQPCVVHSSDLHIRVPDTGLETCALRSVPALWA
jgi:hypothetical protein